METSVITAATPIITPDVVRMERSLFDIIELRAILNGSTKFIVYYLFLSAVGLVGQDEPVF